MLSTLTFSIRILIVGLFLALPYHSFSIDKSLSPHLFDVKTTYVAIDYQFENETNIIFEACIKDSSGKEYGRVVFLVDKYNKSGYIARLHVPREYRQKSYGSMLLTYALKKLSSLHCMGIYWQAYPFDLPSHQTQEIMLPKLIAFYQKHGAEVLSQNAVSAQMVYYPTITAQVA